MGLRASLDGCGKSGPPSGFDLRTVQPVAIPTELSRLKPEADYSGWPIVEFKNEWHIVFTPPIHPNECLRKRWILFFFS